MWDRLRKQLGKLSPETDRLQAFLDQMGAGVVVLGRDYKILHLNDVARSWFGDVEGDYCYYAMRRRKQPCPECPAERVVDEDHPYDKSLRCFSHGAWHLHDSLYLPIRDRDGKTRMIAMISKGPVEGAQLGEGVLRGDRPATGFLDGLDILVVGASSEGKLLFANKAAQALLGYEGGGIARGVDLGDIMPPDARESFMAMSREGRDERKSEVPLILPLIARDGEQRLVSWSFTPLFGTGGEFEGAIGFGQEVTRRVEEERETRQRSGMSALFEAVKVRARKNLVPEQVLAETLSGLMEVPQFKCAAVYLSVPPGGEFRLEAEEGFADDRRPPEVLSAAHHEAFPALARERDGLVVAEEDTRLEPSWSEVLKSPELERAFAVPFAVGERGEGLLVLCAEGPGTLHQEEEKSLLEGLAWDLGGALENAILHQETKRSLTESAALFELSRKITGARDPQSALGEVARKATELVEADYCSILLFDEERGELEGTVWVGGTDAGATTERHPLSYMGTVAESARTLEPVLCDDPAADSRIPRGIVEERDISSQLVVPLVVGQGFIGVVVLERHAGAPPFGSHDTELVSAFAAQASVVIENARLVQDLKRSEEQHRQLLESVGEMVFMVDTEGTVRFVNHRVESMLGYRPEEVVGKSFTEFFPEEKERLNGMLERGLKGERVDLGRVRAVTKGGGEVVMEVAPAAVHADGKIVGFTGICRDVTEERRATETLRETEERYRKLVESSAEAIVLIEQWGESRILFVNSGAEEMFGVSGQELEGRSSTDLLHPDERERVSEDFRRAWEKREPLRDYVMRCLIGGREFLVEANAAYLDVEDTEGQVMLVLHDITDRVKTEKTLRDSIKFQEALFRAMPEAVLYLRGDRVIWCNQAGQDIFGRSPEDIRGKRIPELHDEDGPWRERGPHILELLGEEGFQSWVMEGEKEGGGRFVAEVSASVISEAAEGEHAEVVLVVRDITQRKEALDSLRESEESYRAVVDSSLDGIVIHDGHRVLFANRRLSEIVGYEVEEVEDVEKAISDFVVEDPDLLLDRLRRRRSGKEAEERYEATVRRKDGRLVHLELRNSRIKLRGKTAFLVLVSDITDRKEAEQELLRNAAEYAVLFDAIPEMALIVDMDGTMVEVNRGCLRRLGYEEKDLVGRRVGEIETPEYAKSVTSRLQHIGYEMERPYEVEYLAKDGTVVPVELATRKIIYRGREAAFMVARDITDRKEAESALRDSEERYRTLVESSHDIILLVNQAGEIQFANPAVESILGVSPDDVTGKSIMDFVHPDERERVARDFARDWLSGITLPNYRVKALNAEGETIYIDATSGFVGDIGAGAVQVFVLKDITDLVNEEIARERRLDNERAVARATARFVEVEDVEGAFRDTLEEVRDLVGVDRAHIAYVSGETGGEAEVQEIVVAEQDAAQDWPELDPGWLEDWCSELPVGEALVVDDTSTLPHDQGRPLVDRGAKAIAAAPLVVKSAKRGFIDVQMTGGARRWKNYEYNLVGRLARVMSGFLERHEAAERLAESERFMSAVTASMVQGIVTARRVGEDTITTWVNERMAEMYGYEPEEMIGQSVEPLFAGRAEYIDYGRELYPALKETGSHIAEMKGKRKDGSLFDVRLSTTILEGRGGQELMGTVMDITEEKRMREMVRAAAEAYSTLFSSSGDGLLVHTLDGEIREANERAAELLMRDKEDLIGVKATELVPDWLARHYPERVEEMREMGISIFEAKFLRPDGSMVECEVTARTTRIWGEDVVLASLRDITARKLAEREIEKRAGQLAALNEIAWAAASALGVDQMLQRTLAKAVEALGADVGSVFVADDSGESMKMAAQIGHRDDFVGELKEGISGEMLAGIVMTSGEPLVISDLSEEEQLRKIPTVEYVLAEGERSATIIPLKTSDRVLGTFGLGSKRAGTFDERDTDFLSAIGSHLGVALENAIVYERIAEEHRRVALLQRTAAASTKLADPSELLEAILKITVEEFGADSGVLAAVEPGVDEFVWKVGYNVDMEMVRGISIGKTSGVGGTVVSSKKVVNFKRKDGVQADDLSESLGVQNALLCPLVSGGRVLGVMGIHTEDVEREFTEEDEEVIAAIGRQAGVAIERANLYQETKRHLEELRRAHEELKVLDKMKSDFVSTVSHELRSPLAVIEGFSKTLVAHFDELDRATERESLEIILNKSLSLERLIENILDMSRIEEGRLEVRREKVDLGQVCKQACSEQARTSTAHEFRITIPDELPFVIADREKVEVAIGNLVGNAIKFSPGGGKVAVKVAPNDREAIVSVKDEGIGISEEQQERIFDRFYQVESGETRAYPGSGLGLYITRELIEAMGGTIKVESRPGKGSTFTFTLPLAR